eukprot:6196394-Pleurochrysis_carterae.AAC.3
MHEVLRRVKVVQGQIGACVLQLRAEQVEASEEDEVVGGTEHLVDGHVELTKVLVQLPHLAQHLLEARVERRAADGVALSKGELRVRREGAKGRAHVGPEQVVLDGLHRRERRARRVGRVEQARLARALFVQLCVPRAALHREHDVIERDRLLRAVEQRERRRRERVDHHRQKALGRRMPMLAHARQLQPKVLEPVAQLGRVDVRLRLDRHARGRGAVRHGRRVLLERGGVGCGAEQALLERRVDPLEHDLLPRRRQRLQDGGELLCRHRRRVLVVHRRAVVGDDEHGEADALVEARRPRGDWRRQQQLRRAHRQRRELDGEPLRERARVGAERGGRPAHARRARLADHRADKRRTKLDRPSAQIEPRVTALSTDPLDCRTARLKRGEAAAACLVAVVVNVPVPKLRAVSRGRFADRLRVRCGPAVPWKLRREQIQGDVCRALLLIVLGYQGVGDGHGDRAVVSDSMLLDALRNFRRQP